MTKVPAYAGDTRTGRPADVQQIIDQINRWTILGVSGGRLYVIHDDNGDPVGLRLPINGTRFVDVVLDWSDTYTVSRRRLIVRGNDRGGIITEDTRSDVYCDELDAAVWKASNWK